MFIPSLVVVRLASSYHCAFELLRVTHQQEAGLFIVERQMPYKACVKSLSFLLTMIDAALGFHWVMPDRCC